MLIAEKITKSYNDDVVLNNADITVNEGEFVALMGASGSGKSTLMHCISGIDKPDSGRVLFNNNVITDMPDKKLADIRLNQIGFVFQQIHLMKNLSIFDNILFPAYAAGKPKAETGAYARELIQRMGIEKIALNDITKVSGGQRQRAAICRALINKPKIIFADEPTGSLDSKSSAEVMKLLKEINQSGTSIFLITHDERIAAEAGKVYHIRDGVILGGRGAF